MVTLYARYEIVKEKREKHQYLEEHLLGTADEIVTLLNKEPIKNVVEVLSLNTKTNFDNILEAAKLAALFHDIGKSMHYYQKQAVEVIERRKDRMNFQYHEVISAYILAKTFTSTETSLKPPWLQPLIVQAILLHHQGLRVLTLEKIEEPTIFNKILHEKPNKSLENIEKMCEKIITANKVSKLAKTIAENIVEIMPRIVKEPYKPKIITDYYALRGTSEEQENRVELSRITTGCLMIADVKNAYKAVGGTASKYVKDILKV